MVGEWVGWGVNLRRSVGPVAAEERYRRVLGAVGRGNFGLVALCAILGILGGLDPGMRSLQCYDAR